MPNDLNLGQPIRTLNPGDAIVKIADATTPAQQLAVDSSGKIGTKLSDGAGNAITSTTVGSQQPLDVNIVQGGGGGVPDESTFTYGTSTEVPIGGVFQDTSPTITAGKTGAIRITANRAMHSNLRDSSGNELLGQKASAASIPVVLASDQSHIPVELQDGSGNAITSQTSGGQRALDVGINVAGVQVDPRSIRALTASDVVTAAQGAPNTLANAWSVKPTDGTNSQSYTGAGEAKVDITQPLPAGTNNIGKVSVQDSSGNPFSPTNPLPVSIGAPGGTEVNDYLTNSALAGGASINHDYAITSGKTFKGRMFWASAGGLLKAEVQISPDGSTFNTKWVGFNSPSDPNINIQLDNLTVTESGTGSVIRIILTNREASVCDIYSTISGNEF